MTYVAGSAIIIALVFLIFAATVGPSAACLRKLRHMGYILALALAGMVTAGDVTGLALLAVPSIALYEVAVWATA